MAQQRPLGPFVRLDDGLRVHVRVTAGAGADALDGLHAASDGAMSLKVRVRAQPEKGRANKAVMALLAKALGVAKSDVALLSGAKDRNKAFAVTGDVNELERALAALLDGEDEGS